MNSPDAGAASSPRPGGEDGGDLDRRKDRFYGGRFALLQPVGAGLRSGLDALLLAATVPPHAVGRLADLGAGTGAVGLAACCRAPRVEATLVEKDAAIADLALATIALPENREWAPRLRLVRGDLLASRGEREAAGLRDGAFDHVLTNPPYHPHDHRASPDTLRAAATIAAGEDFLGRWFRVSAALLRHGGTFAAVLRTDALPTVLDAASRFLGGVRVLPVHSRHGADAGRILVLCRKGSRAPFAILPGVFLHDAAGQPTPLSEAISNGTAALAIPDRD